jgi:uncharacterized iron-regulated membrane protein
MHRGRTSLPTADFGILLFLVCLTGLGIAFAFFMYTLMSPTVLKNSGAPSYKASQSAIILSPRAAEERAQMERAAVAKAKEMNAALEMNLAVAKDPEPMRRAEARPKTRREVRKRVATRLARVPNSTGPSAWGYAPQTAYGLPQPSYAFSW